MVVYAKVKALAKRRPVIDKVPIELPEGILTSNQLVEAIVRQNVKDFNKKETDKQLFSYLLKEEMENMEKSGKIGFQDKKNENIQNEDEAVRNALECYGDGIFRVFLNGEEVERGTEIEIHNGDELLFMRVTMLAGRLW